MKSFLKNLIFEEQNSPETPKPVQKPVITPPSTEALTPDAPVDDAKVRERIKSNVTSQSVVVGKFLESVESLKAFIQVEPALFNAALAASKIDKIALVNDLKHINGRINNERESFATAANNKLETQRAAVNATREAQGKKITELSAQLVEAQKLLNEADQSIIQLEANTKMKALTFSTACDSLSKEYNSLLTKVTEYLK